VPQGRINQNLYYRWSKEFLEAGKKRLAGDTAREATSDEVKGLRAQARQLKELMAELMLENRLLKKACWRMGSPIPEVRGGGEAGDYPAGRAVVVAGAGVVRNFVFLKPVVAERSNCVSNCLTTV
jgi:transposase